MPRTRKHADRTRRVEAATNNLKGRFEFCNHGKTATQIYEEIAKKAEHSKGDMTTKGPQL